MERYVDIDGTHSIDSAYLGLGREATRPCIPNTSTGPSIYLPKKTKRYLGGVHVTQRHQSHLIGRSGYVKLGIPTKTV